MAVNLGKGTIGVGLEDQTKPGLNKIEKNAGKVSSNIEDKFKKLGGIIAAAFAGTAIIDTIKTLGTEAIALAGDLNDMSQALDINAESLGALQYAGVKAGVGIEKLQNIFLVLTDKLQEAKDGSEKTQEAFDKLNIDYKNISVEEAISQLLQLGNSGKLVETNFAALSDIMGRKLALNVKKISGEVKSFEDATNQARKGNALFTKESQDSLAKLGDQWDAMKMSLAVSFAQGFTGEFSGTESFEKLAESLAKTAREFGIVVGGLADLITWLKGGKKEATSVTNDFQKMAISIGAVNSVSKSLAATNKVVKMNQSGVSKVVEDGTKITKNAAKVNAAAAKDAKKLAKATEEVGSAEEGVIKQVSRVATEGGGLATLIATKWAAIHRWWNNVPIGVENMRNTIAELEEIVKAGTEAGGVQTQEAINAANRIKEIKDANVAAHKSFDAVRKTLSGFADIPGLGKLGLLIGKMMEALGKIPGIGILFRKAWVLAVAFFAYDWISAGFKYNSLLKGAAYATLRFVEILDWFVPGHPIEDWINKLDKEWIQYADNQQYVSKEVGLTNEQLKESGKTLKDLKKDAEDARKSLADLGSDFLPDLPKTLKDMAQVEGFFLLLKQQSDKKAKDEKDKKQKEREDAIKDAKDKAAQEIKIINDLADSINQAADTFRIIKIKPLEFDDKGKVIKWDEEKILTSVYELNERLKEEAAKRLEPLLIDKVIDISGGDSFEKLKSVRDIMNETLNSLIDSKTNVAKNTEAFNEFAKSGLYTREELEKIASLLNLEMVKQTPFEKMKENWQSLVDDVKQNGLLKAIKSNADGIKQAFGAIGDVTKSVFSAMSDVMQQKIDNVKNQLDSLRASWDADKASLEEAGLQNTIIYEQKEALMKAEESRLKKEAERNWTRQKSMQVSIAQMNAIQASLGAFTSVISTPFIGPILAPIAAAAALVAGMANVKSIQQQPMPKFALGGYINGNKYGDNIPIMAMGGEFMVNRAATEANRNLLSSINNGTYRGSDSINITINNPVGETNWVENNLIPELNKAFKRNVNMSFAR